MSLRYDDLPAKLRAQVDQATGTVKKQRTTQRRGPVAGRLPGRCAACDEVCPTEAGEERHPRDTGHGRMEYVRAVELEP